MQSMLTRSARPAPLATGRSTRQRAVRVQARAPLVGKALTGNNVIQLGAVHRHSATVPRNADPNLSLNQYMESLGNDFTVLQIPMGAQIVRSGQTGYKIIVPKIQLFDVWFQPEADAITIRKPNVISLQSNTCSLNGSKHVTDLKLNDVFNLEVNVSFAWDDRQGQQPTIIGDASLQVDVDVPMPFALMPKQALEMAGNPAFFATLNIMLNGFVNSLVNDYGNWSRDANLRQQRAARSRQAVA